MTEDNNLSVKGSVTVWVCPRCGSEDVEVETWVNMNTGECMGDSKESGDAHAYYCPDCEVHLSRVDEKKEGQ